MAAAIGFPFGSPSAGVRDSHLHNPNPMSADQLEQSILSERWRQLATNRRKLESQSAFARAESRRIDHRAKKLAAQEEAWRCATEQQHHHFIPQSVVKAAACAAEERVHLVVGGQGFECSAALLQKDPHSMLAALCAPSSPLRQQPPPAGGSSNGADADADADAAADADADADAAADADADADADAGDEEGAPVACFDRDWWIFRYILNFLRDGSIPSEPPLVWRLYEEAAFWGLLSLQRAIEQRFIGVFRRGAGIPGDEPGQLSAGEYRTFVEHLQKQQGIVPNADGDISKKQDKPKLPTAADWWAKPPEWWGEKPKPKPKPKPGRGGAAWDWWNKCKHGGLDFTYTSDWKSQPPLNTKEKESQKKKMTAEKDAQLHSTFSTAGMEWAAPHTEYTGQYAMRTTHAASFEHAYHHQHPGFGY